MDECFSVWYLSLASLVSVVNVDSRLNHESGFMLPTVSDVFYVSLPSNLLWMGGILFKV